MRETNTTTAGTKSAGPPKAEAPQAIGQMADRGIAQAKQSYAKANATTAEASNILENACSTAAQGVMACNAKVIEFARANTSAAFDYGSDLLRVKSPSEFLKVTIQHARKQLEVLSEQTKEFTVLSQKVMLETAEPLKAGVVKAFRGHLG
jgi:phasin